MWKIQMDSTTIIILIVLGIFWSYVGYTIWIDHKKYNCNMMANALIADSAYINQLQLDNAFTWLTDNKQWMNLHYANMLREYLHIRKTILSRK